MIRRGGALAAVLLLAGGCGGGSTVTAGSGTPTTAANVTAAGPATAATGVSPTISGPAPPAAPAGDRSASILPSVEMSDVARGTTVDLASLIPAQRPVLLWFWAPH